MLDNKVWIYLDLKLTMYEFFIKRFVSCHSEYIYIRVLIYKHTQM